MEQEPTQVRAAIYARKSVVQDDKDAESIEVQLKHCHQRADTIGATVIKEFIDSGISASKGLQRPGYLELLEYIKDGRLDVVIVRDQARISREEIELFIFLKTSEQAGIKVQDSYGQDIKNDLAAKVRALMDADYARQVGKNVKLKKQMQAESGKPPSSRNRPYGYEHNYAAVIPDEAKIFKEIVERFVAGESLHGITLDLNARGDLKYSGKKWRSQDLSQMIKRPEYAALRSFNGEVVAKGTWEPIITEEEHKQVLEALAENKPFARNTARKHLLTGIIACNLCGTLLSAKIAGPKKQGKYYCNQTRGGCGKVLRDMKAIDEFMIWLTHEAIKRLPSVKQQEVENYSAKEIAKLEEKIAESMEAYNEGVLTLAEFVKIKQTAQEKIKPLRKAQIKAVKLPVEDAQAFLKASVDKQRATIGRMFKVVGLKPTGAKGSRFNPNQLVFHND